MSLTKATNSMIVGAAINPQDYGADNTGVADSSAQLGAAAAAAAASGLPLYLNGTYKISGTFVLSAVNFVQSDNCTIVPTMDTGVAVLYAGPDGDFIENKKLLGNLTVNWPVQDWTKERVSFQITNVYNSEFHISSLKATRGLFCFGINKGVVYNDFYLGAFFNNSVGVWLDAADNTGWCNMNRFHGGYFFGDGNVTGSLYAAYASHIYAATSPYAVNGNVFLYPSLEWGNTTGGFVLTRFGGLRNKLFIGYAEIVNVLDTPWFLIGGLQNFVDCTQVPYVIGYDPNVSGILQRVDASSATDPWIAGAAGYVDLEGQGSQIWKTDSITKPAMLLQNAGGGPSLQLQSLSQSGDPALEILGTTGASGVSIPAAGIWTVFGGTRKVIWSGTAPPVSNTWTRGDILWNSEPSAGGIPGWICVTSGTPGTWKAMANLAA